VLIETARRHVVDHALAQRADGLVERRHGGRIAGVDLDLASLVEQRADESLGQFGGRERAGAVVFRGLGSPPGVTPSHGRDGVTACRNEVKSPLASQ
jgi:hypothetical protein